MDDTSTGTNSRESRPAKVRRTAEARLSASEQLSTMPPLEINATTTSEEPKMSKSQLKRKRRYEKKMEVKRRRKQQEKEAKVAKAIAEGRDLEAERRFQAERTASGEGNKQRQEIWEKYRLPHTLNSFQVGLDCSFASLMTSKEINSLASQIRYCYSNNKRSRRPCLLAATSLEGETLEHLQNVCGFDDWHKRAFTHTQESLKEFYKDRMEKIVYLTSDSETTLTELEDNKIYIIGGIVDRNRLKRAAINRAEALGVATAKLPLDEHLKKMQATRVLTVNHVFEIMIRYRENGKDWKKALLDVLPHRKEVRVLAETGSDKGAASTT